ncbi:MAG TPA: 50S ribosomal protein L31e [Candidatus Sulfotelmatobacter sp.]|nr:50S ribosomal protein L31e [Candidatus Sulfotelmatobacter sp.]
MNNEETSNVPDEEPILDEELETELNEEAPIEATETEATEETKEMPAEEKKEEEEKPKRKRKGKPEEEIVEEKIYTIPLAKATIRPPKKRAPRAIQLIREFITKHMKIEMKVEEEEEEGEFPRLIISREVNEKIWDKGIEKPPRRIRVRAAKDSDGNVTVYLAAGE